MTSLPPEAAGPQGDAPASEAEEASHPRAAPPRLASHRFETQSESRPRVDRSSRVERGERTERIPRYEWTERGASYPGSRPAPPVQASNAPVELTLDLLATPPDKVLPRVFGALERVSSDVTLIVLLRDTPEYIGVTASVYQALRGRGYFSDSARLPTGCQRLRIQRRRAPPRATARYGPETETEPVFAPAPPGDLPPAESAAADWSGWADRPAEPGQVSEREGPPGTATTQRMTEPSWLPAPAPDVPPAPPENPSSAPPSESGQV